MRALHVFGDSHVEKFAHAACGMPVVLDYCVGATAHNLCEIKSLSNSHYRLERWLESSDDPDAIWLLVLGEIDCRIHIHQQSIKTGLTRCELIADSVSRYMMMVRRAQARQWRIAVLDVPPVGTQGNYYNIEHYASREERAQIVCLWNMMLLNECQRWGVVYVDLWSHVADLHGFVREEYLSEDGVHIKPTAVRFVVEQLNAAFPERG